ncbi:MAG TPA: hypothetical protein VL128_01240 [Candidatus Eisenbacteria bacterium]|nr:hypothetical protein [Candidatus Eisenbacteria bacterium]
MIIQIAPSEIQQIDPISKALSSLFMSALSLLIKGLDESVRQDLEALRNKYFAYLVAATVAVALGVILEEAEEWLRYVNRLLPLKEITEYRLARKLVKLGWMLIVIGVMGEGVFEVLVSRADALAHAFDEILLMEARKQAGDAATSAKIAREEADASEVAAKSAKQEAEDVSKLANQLHGYLTPRSLTQKEMDDLRDSLKPFADPNILIVVEGSWGAPTVPIQVWNSIKAAGFERADLRLSWTWLPQGMGASSPPKYAYLTGRIAGAIMKLGIVMDGVQGVTADTEPITIVIGDIRAAALPAKTNSNAKH